MQTFTTVGNAYEHALAFVYNKIDKKGLYIAPEKLHPLRLEVIKLQKAKLEELSNLWNCHVYLGAENGKGKPDSINLNSKKKLLEKLKGLGFNIPKVRKKDKETGDVEFKESTEELALQRAFAEETDSNRIRGLRLMLEVAELNTLYIRYINAKLYNNIFYSNYNIAGTVTGRRSCRKNPFGLGGNAQNFPKHYEIGKRFIECISARPNRIFFIVDQMQAEDWPVSALAENYNALQQLQSGFDRHTDLASFIFGIPKSSRTTKEWKDSIERYLGKKTRHAHNYGMRGQMMSDSLAKEGFNISKTQCDAMLDKVKQYDPQVESVFHYYIKNQLYTHKKLSTPLGRERYFFGLQQNNSNYKILNEAYSYIPQSTVGDNTGLAVLGIYNYNVHRTGEFNIVSEGHDSITQEVSDEWEEIKATFDDTGRAFKRTITFHNGISIEIPIEAEIGHDLLNTVKLKTYTEESLRDAYHQLKNKTGAGSNATNVSQAVVGSI